jgi:signal transduction histidine kinase
LRLIPNIRYGTDGYPDKIARRLAATNIATSIGAVVTAIFAVLRFLDPRPGMWKFGVVNALGTLLFGSIPLLHRFGPLAAPLAVVGLAYAWIVWTTSHAGTDGGAYLTYFTAAALGILLVGAERVALTMAIGGMAAGLIILVHFVFPRDGGYVSPRSLFYGNFVTNVVASSPALYGIVFYAVRQFARAEERLELANLAKSRFLAAASHDLRQPMHALGLFVAQLRSHMTSTEGSRLVDRIDDAVNGMNELFNALLDITKLDAGALTATIAEFPIAELLGRIGSTFAPVAQEKGLSLVLVPSSAWVRSDPVLLERIVLNLVSNALRYTNAGGIVVGCRHRGAKLRIEVWDTGPGIPPDQYRNIFSEFYRLADAAKTNEAGLGLGLAIVDRLCTSATADVAGDGEPLSQERGRMT